MKYNPIHVILAIKKMEYRYLLLPFALIVGAFVSVKFYDIIELKFLSILAIAIYFMIRILFRINKISPSEIDESEKTIKSPINGKVINIENNTITIKKSLLNKADFRSTDAKYRMLTNKPIIIEENKTQSVLVGAIPKTAICELIILADYKINVKLGQKIVSGLTNLGIYNENE